MIELSVAIKQVDCLCRHVSDGETVHRALQVPKCSMARGDNLFVVYTPQFPVSEELGI